MDKELALASIAALYHDPPWKPWVILGKISENELLEKLKNNNLKGILEEYMRILGSANIKDISSHERQAILIPLSIAERLKDNKREDLARVFSQIAEILAGKDLHLYNIVKKADVYASAIDRHMLYELLKNEGLERTVFVRTLKFINPFTLEALIIPEYVEPQKIISFLKGYSDLVADAVSQICMKKLVEECLTTILTVGFLLLEPSWYYFTESVPGHKSVYVPLADTRIPTHTLFDHIDAVLTMLILIGQGKDNGCIGILDLAGIQAWISESRRLKDLWASSWLASFLSWKGIESLVKKYGPGIMISPSARLNPFLSARMLGKWLFKIRNSKENEWIWPALGIDEKIKWPIHPVLPGKLLIAIPHVECESISDKISKDITSTWQEIMKEILNKIEPICENMDYSNCLIKDNKIKLIVEKLEPPLAIRVYTNKINIPEIRQKTTTSEQTIYTWYENALKALKLLEEKTKISAPGRRTGQRYLELAEEAYKKGVYSNCTICGKSLAIIDFRDKRVKTTHDKILLEIGTEKLCPYCLVKRLFRYIITNNKEFAEKLVGLPYDSRIAGVRWKSVWDHSSRMQIMRTVLENNIPAEIKKIIETKDVELDPVSIIDIYFAIGSPPLQDSMPHQFEKLLLEQVKDRSERAYLSKILWSIIAAVLDDPELLIKAAKITGYNKKYHEIFNILMEITEELRRLYGRIPRRYAIIMADGDYMGKGLLSGKIPIGWILKKEGKLSITKNKIINPASPNEYFKENVVLPEIMVLNEELAKKIKQTYEKLGKSIDELISLMFLDTSKKSLCNDACDPIESGKKTIIVTPSYHATISRSLALVSALDAKKTAKHGAEIIYLGGDDALLIAPPISLMSTESSDKSAYKVTLTALEVSKILRENWRGYQTRVPGFLFLTFKIKDSKYRTNYRVLHFAPAPGAYGRTTSIYLADAKKPMWLAMMTSTQLENIKDDASTFIKDQLLFKKDLLIITSDTRGAFIAPLSLWPGEFNSEWPLRSIMLLLCLTTLRKEKRALSAKILHDLPILAGKLGLAMINIDKDMGMLKKVVSATLSNAINKESFLENIKIKRPKHTTTNKDLALILINKLLDPFYNEIDKEIREELILLRLPRDKLIIHGTDYGENRYLKVLSDNNAVILPIVFAPFGLAYVYDSAVYIPKDIDIECFKGGVD